MRIQTLATALILCVACHAQESRKYPTSTSAIPPARYEIVQSPILARDTFKLDRFRGRVWQRVETADKTIVWELMVITDEPGISASAAVPRFQLYLSGIVARDSFLVDTISGTVWTETSVTDSEGKELYLAWVPIQTPTPPKSQTPPAKRAA